MVSCKLVLWCVHWKVVSHSNLSLDIPWIFQCGTLTLSLINEPTKFLYKNDNEEGSFEKANMKLM